MGVEVTDICMDKESDCVVVYPNGISNDLIHGTAPHHDVLESFEPINGVPELQSSEESSEAKEYEVKECTTEVSAESNETSRAGKSKEEDKVNSENEKKNVNKSRSRVRHPSKASPGVVRTKHTVPQPFALATEKRASSGTRPTGSDLSATAGMKSSYPKNVLHPNPTKQNQPLGVSRKPLQPNNKKHPDEEDNCSVTSTPAKSARANGKSTTMAASAPVFRSSERAEKRKEFYSKLEEKHQALEAEKTQSEARTKEEKEADIRQLRKSLLFKANPMPSFYHEGPPPKIELKKLPPTRAKSPKLGRRKSCSDAVNPSQADKVKGPCGQENRQSSGSKEEDLNYMSKDQHNILNGHTVCKPQDENEQEKVVNNAIPPEVNEQNTSSIGA